MKLISSLDAPQLIILLVAVITSLVLPPVSGAGPGMNEEPSTPASPSTTSTPVSPSTTGPSCEDEQQEPTTTEKCRTTAGVYMGLDDESNLIFSSDIKALPNEKVSIYSVVQKNFEQKKRDFETGMFVGYNYGLEDGLKGQPSNPDPNRIYRTPEQENLRQGFTAGYSDGYAAGVFEKNFQHINTQD